mmetsp:Transcript_36867/g.113092  ORF Transcript_36867/g.113092 Transcript_36867/m.113092 type:complete len:147 (-) Transcript_36867:1111-1551(-)
MMLGEDARSALAKSLSASTSGPGRRAVAATAGVLQRRLDMLIRQFFFLSDLFLSPRKGTNTDRTVYGAASASASSFVVHHTQQISMAAVAGDADNINKQARKMRTNWTKNKQAANGLLSLVLGPSGGCPRRQALRTGPSTLHVRIM